MGQVGAQARTAGRLKGKALPLRARQATRRGDNRQAAEGRVNENVLPLRARQATRRGGNRLGRRGQGKGEPAPYSDLALDPDPSTLCFDQNASDVQAQTQALPAN